MQAAAVRISHDVTACEKYMYLLRTLKLARRLTVLIAIFPSALSCTVSGRSRRSMN